MNLAEYVEKKQKGASKPPNKERTAEYKPLERFQQNEREAEERARQVYAEYQNNIKLSSQTQTEILKGLKAGEDITTLFLKGCKVISLMTSNSLFYEQAREDIKAIYGIGLEQPGAVKIELEEVQGRLKMLTRPELQNEPTESKQRINRAIREHRERERQLTELLSKGA